MESYVDAIYIGLHSQTAAAAAGGHQTHRYRHYPCRLGS